MRNCSTSRTIYHIYYDFTANRTLPIIMYLQFRLQQWMLCQCHGGGCWDMHSPNCNHHASVKQNYVRPIPDSSHSTSISSSKLVSSHSKPSRRKSTRLPPIKSLLNNRDPKFSTEIRENSNFTLCCNQESSPSKFGRNCQMHHRINTKVYKFNLWFEVENICYLVSIKENWSDLCHCSISFYLKQRGLATRTLEGYRSAIASTLKHASTLDLSNNMEISVMLKNFRQTSIFNRNPAPKWNLTLVLNMLRNGPFAPLDTVSLKLLTLKTVFLLAFASGKRRGEIHVIHKKTMSWPHNKNP